MNFYVITTNPGCGEYVYLVKARDENDAIDILSFLTDMFESIASIKLLSDFLKECDNFGYTILGGYSE